MDAPIIRRATKEDAPSLGRLGAALVRFHHLLDSRRFMLVEPVESGYEWWLTQELSNPKAVILVAEAPESVSPEQAGGSNAGQGGAIVGYAYGRLEARDWNALLDAHGALHDVLVTEGARKQGTGAALVEAMIRELKKMGAPRVVLSTATQNEAAQRLFERLGFRRTMIEMTRDL